MTEKDKNIYKQRKWLKLSNSKLLYCYSAVHDASNRCAIQVHVLLTYLLTPIIYVSLSTYVQ